VIGVVASAASTATGAFDPLEPIADFCAAHDLWLHVDGAHGAAVALSDRYRSLVAGVERADSVVWDAHKMLLQPALVTAVLFRDAARSYATFAQEASYLFARPTDLAWWNGSARTIECTKRMIAFKLYATLAIYGRDFFARYVERCVDRAAHFARSIAASDDFELAVEPQCNIVCFRHRPSGAVDLDAVQEEARRRLLDEGSFYIVQTRLPTGIFLRVTVINPLTTVQVLAALLDRIRAFR
jgi:L-2,4-diaminobutyrate decarboxylase